MNADHDGRLGADGWPEDEHPIFIDSGFGHVTPSTPVRDGLNERRPLTSGASIRADAEDAEFAVSWAAILSEKPVDADRWEYSVEQPQAEEDPVVTGILPIDEALDRVRRTPGARLRRRAVGRWHVTPTPFPRLETLGWAELEAEKDAWHAALNEFPPSYRGVISRMGGVEHAPEAWISYARRAAAVGFTPSAYRMLGTAHLAWRTRAARDGRRSIPELETIEVWAQFPQRVREGQSLLEAVEAIARGMR